MTETQAKQLARDALPCPFCGERLEALPDLDDYWIVRHPYVTERCFSSTARNGVARIVCKADLERWNRRAGPWCPPSARTPVSPCDCKHENTLFVQSSHAGGGGYYELGHVSVCVDCGTFLISRQQNTERMRAQFQLPTWELVQAAGQMARLLSKE